MQQLLDCKKRCFRMVDGRRSQSSRPAKETSYSLRRLIDTFMPRLSAPPALSQSLGCYWARRRPKRSGILGLGIRSACCRLRVSVRQLQCTLKLPSKASQCFALSHRLGFDRSRDTSRRPGQKMNELRLLGGSWVVIRWSYK